MELLYNKQEGKKIRNVLLNCYFLRSGGPKGTPFLNELTLFHRCLFDAGRRQCRNSLTY